MNYITFHIKNIILCLFFRQSLEINPDNPANLRRIGYGIMNLPKRIADYDLALKCLLKSLSLCENLNTLHIIGTFYHRYGNVSNYLKTQ